MIGIRTMLSLSLLGPGTLAGAMALGIAGARTPHLHPPQPTACSQVLAIADPTIVNLMETGPTIYGQRLTIWNDPTLSVKAGKWVGIVSRDNSGNSAKPPHFPDLPKNGKGCLFFKDTDDPAPIGRHVDAYYQGSNDGQVKHFPAALICYLDTSHLPEAQPVPDTAADQCPIGSNAIYTVSPAFGVTLTIPIPVDSLGLDADLRKALDAALPAALPGRAGFLRAAVAAAGPWFPCEASGCCRLY